MMPLSLAKVGEDISIKKISGKSDARLFLKKLGFVPGAHVCIVTKLNENVIVNIKESRIAISREMAAKIMV